MPIFDFWEGRNADGLLLWDLELEKATTDEEELYLELDRRKLGASNRKLFYLFLT